MHAGIICKIGEISKHSNADSLYITKLFGTQIIIKDDVKEGDIGIYFNSDLQLSQEFCNANKLLRKAHGGYVDDSKRNVRALKLRGEISDGLWLKLSSLSSFGDVSTLKVGQHISEFNGTQIACKYVPVQKEERIRTNTPKQKGSNSSMKIKYPTFVEHRDTMQYDYNKHRLQVGDMVEITLKMHGTSNRTCHSLKKTTKTNFFRRLLKLPIIEKMSWDYVSGTRRVVLKSNGEDSFYKDTFRKNWHDFFVGKLHKGETVFSEIVGFLDSGKPIMPSADNKKVNDKSFVKQFGDKTIYSYGCQENENDMYVYRMTLTNEDGHCIEYSPEQMRQRCEQIGVKTVPVLWSGVITDLDEFDRLVTELSDGVDPVGKTHIREGIIIRKLNSPTIEVLKKKGQTFKILENLVKDSGILDMEEAESLETQEF